MDDFDDPKMVGEQNYYFIIVSNEGNVPVTNIQIRAFLPNQLEFARANGPTDNKKQIDPARKVDTVLFEPLPTLAPGAQVRYEVHVTNRKAGKIIFRVEVTADQLTTGPVVVEEPTFIESDKETPRTPF